MVPASKPLELDTATVAVDKGSAGTEDDAAAALWSDPSDGAGGHSVISLKARGDLTFGWSL